MYDARQKIRDGFASFVLALQQNDLEAFDKVFCKDAVFETQPFGNFQGTREAKRRFCWQGPQLDVSRYKIYNNCIFAEEDHGLQSAYVVALTGQLLDGYLHHFQFGGHYLIYWKKREGQWKIVRMKYCLDMEFGNTSFVAGWWKMIDYTVYGGYKNHPIQPAVDAPWRLYPQKRGWSEDEKIIDLYNRYAWGIDEDDFEITASALSEKAWANIPGNAIPSKEALIAMLRSKRLKENTMSHVGKIVGVNRRDKTAELYVWRYEPHRIGTKILHAGNMDRMYYSVDYIFHAIIEDSEWKICQIDYQIGIFDAPVEDAVYQ